MADKPDYWQLVKVPALITLAVTFLRLIGEFMDLPAFLANKEAGGPGAIIGIVWLAPIFGVYFAKKLAPWPGSLWKHLFKTLGLYALAARIPVIIIMGLAIFGEWGTHYDAFPPPPAFPFTTPMMQFLVGGVVIQLVFWALIWTVGTGMLFGLIGAKIRSPQEVTAQP